MATYVGLLIFYRHFDEKRNSLEVYFNCLFIYLCILVYLVMLVVQTTEVVVKMAHTKYNGRLKVLRTIPKEE